MALNDAKRQPDSMPGTATSKAIAQQVQLKICMDILHAAGNVRTANCGRVLLTTGRPHQHTFRLRLRVPPKVNRSRFHVASYVTAGPRVMASLVLDLLPWNAAKMDKTTPVSWRPQLDFCSYK
jgi:hypothetical protein